MAGGRREMPGPLTRNTAAILAARATALHFSQADLAAAVDISQTQMGRYLRAERVPNIEELRRISAALGLDFVDDVLRPASE